MSTPPSSDGMPLPCDVCNVAEATQWCEDCQATLCATAECVAKHEGHAVGLLGDSGDPYDYEGEGCIDEKITEEAAYHLLEMLESNAHIMCRKLFDGQTRSAANALRKSLPAASTGAELRQMAASSTAAFGADGPVHLTEEQWALFAANSFLVLDNFVDPATALAAKEQTLSLVAADQLTEFRNPLDVGRDPSARSDLRMFMDVGAPPTDEGPLKVLGQRLGELQAALEQHFTLRGHTHELQLAYYGSEGQKYDRHRDAMPNDGSRAMDGQVGRRVTCTLYMNDHRPEHEGCLRLHAPTVGFDAEEVMDVAPVAGRAVLFLSGALDHEVRPSKHPRCAIAAWYS